jgi:dihydroneopterin aldolase
VPYTIAIRDIRASGRHGALPGERDREQPFDIDLELDVDISRARTSDDLADTVDYGLVHARIIRLVAERSYVLLERLGDEILADLMRDGRIRHASVTIAKPKLMDGATPAVRVSAGRRDG